MAKKETKEELRKKLNAITEQEHKEFIDLNYPILVKEFVGSCFKQKLNYGGEDRRPWFRYTKVLSMEPDDVYSIHDGTPTAHCKVVTFQHDIYGNIHFETKQTIATHNLGTKISEDQYNKAWNSVMDTLDNL